MSLTFSILDGDKVAEVQTFDRDVIKVGKLESAHLRLDGSGVSRMHAVIEVAEGVTYIIDLGSAAGTKVNGEKVNKAKLKQGDCLKFGDVEVIVGIPIGPIEPKPIPITLPDGEIWLVTTVDDRNANNGGLGHRCVGWFDTLAHATTIVMGNYGDIWEHSYKYAVIEPQGQGLYGIESRENVDERTKWFEFVPGPRDENDHRTVTVKSIERPVEYAGICNWGIG